MLKSLILHPFYYDVIGAPTLKTFFLPETWQQETQEMHKMGRENTSDAINSWWSPVTQLAVC